MKEFYFLYKNSVEDTSYKYIIIKAIDILEACQNFVSDFPNAIVSVIYDKDVYPYLKSYL